MAENEDEGLDLSDEDRLPWLESAEDYDGEDEASPMKVVGMVLLGLLAVAAVVGGIYWFQQRDGAGSDGNGELIAAQEGDYKVRPDDPQAKQFDGEGDASFATSEGKQTTGKLATTKSTPVGKSDVRVQLGAFSSAAKANTAWSAISKRFSYVGALPKNVTGAARDGGTIYRLSAVAPNAAKANEVCGKLKAAGESCIVVR